MVLERILFALSDYKIRVSEKSVLKLVGTNFALDLAFKRNNNQNGTCSGLTDRAFCVPTLVAA